MNTADLRCPTGATLPRRALLAAALTGAAAAVTACAPGSGGGHASGVGGNVAPSTDAPAAVSLNIVGVLVGDLDRSLDFYRRLGLDLPESPGGSSYRLRMPDGHVLFWETATAIHTFDPTWELPPTADRRIVLEFGFPTPADLDATYRSLIAAGTPGRLAPFDQGDGIRYAIVVDPDGNQIALRHPAS